MGSDHTFAKALRKAFVGTHVQLPNYGKVLLTIEHGNEDKILPIANRLRKIGWQIITTGETDDFLENNNVHIMKVVQGTNEIKQLLKNGQIDLVINTMQHDYEQNSVGFKIRQDAIAQNVPLMTSLDTVRALLSMKESQALETITIE